MEWREKIWRTVKDKAWTQRNGGRQDMKKWREKKGKNVDVHGWNKRIGREADD